MLVCNHRNNKMWVCHLRAILTNTVYWWYFKNENLIAYSVHTILLRVITHTVYFVFGTMEVCGGSASSLSTHTCPSLADTYTEYIEMNMDHCCSHSQKNVCCVLAKCNWLLLQPIHLQPTLAKRATFPITVQSITVSTPVIDSIYLFSVPLYCTEWSSHEPSHDWLAPCGTK